MSPSVPSIKILEIDSVCRELVGFQLMISLVIPTHNNFADLKRLLSSIIKQKKINSPIEILVISNVFEPQTQKLVRSMNSPVFIMKYFWAGFVGVNKARNKGLRTATHDICLFLNDNCELHDPLYLQKLMTTHAHQHQVVAIGGRHRLPKNSGALAFAYHLQKDYWLSRSKVGGPWTINLLAGHLSVKRSLLGSEIEYDEEDRFGGDEIKFNQSILRARQRMVLDESIEVTCHTVLNLFQFLKKAFFQGGRSFIHGHSAKDVFNLSHRGMPFSEYVKARNLNPGIFVLLICQFYVLIQQFGFEWARVTSQGLQGFPALGRALKALVPKAPLRLSQASTFTELRSAMRLSHELKQLEKSKG